MRSCSQIAAALQTVPVLADIPSIPPVMLPMLYLEPIEAAAARAPGGGLPLVADDPHHVSRGIRSWSLDPASRTLRLPVWPRIGSA